MTTTVSLARYLTEWRSEPGSSFCAHRSALRAPTRTANACLWSVRRECLDHLLILHEHQLSRVLQAYVTYFNRARPHQGLHQQIPDPLAAALPADARDGPILALPVLGGLHHDYRRVA
jgi:hypothetical protein